MSARGKLPGIPRLLSSAALLLGAGLLGAGLLVGLLVSVSSALTFNAEVAGASSTYAGRPGETIPIATTPIPRGKLATGLSSTPTSTPTATCPPGPGMVNVIIENYTFLPQSITVTVGTIVRWSNYDGGITHTSTSDTGIWDSGPLSNGQSFNFTFDNPGSYPYHCAIHPDTMHGAVNIVAGCTPTSTPTSTPTLTRTITPTSAPTASCTPVTRMVMMADFVYNPQAITVTQGSTISWWNEGPSTHTTTSDTGVWDSSNVNPGGTFQFTFYSPGTYPYHCTLHPNMTGTIIVTDCGLPTPTPTPSCPLQWRIVSSPNIGTNDNHLLDMAAVSASDIWAVGYYYNGFASQTLTEHWNGLGWSVVPSPNVGTGTSVLHGVAAVSANDVWAVGYSSVQTLVEHWNGTQWSIVSSPNVGTGWNGLTGVVVVSSNDVWAVGHYLSGAYRTLVEHWNGGFWGVVSSPNVNTDHNFLWGGLTAVSVSDIWAVGSYGASGSGQTLVLHWNGTAWSIVPSPNIGTSENRLYGAAAVATNDVWAVGYHGNYPNEQTLVEHWDGAAWSIVPSPNPSVGQNEFLDVSAVSSSDVWAVGFSGNGTLGTLTEHWDGAQCSALPSPNQPGSNSLEAGTAIYNGYVWAAGEYVNNNLYQTLTLRYSYSGTGCPIATITPTVTNTPTMTPTPICPPVIRTVYSIDFQFMPQALTIVPGSTVSWFNEGPSTHTSTSDTGVWNSGNINPGQSYQFTFNTPGVYPYHCAIHPAMTGTITVTSCVPTVTPTGITTATPTNTPTNVPSPTGTPTPCPPVWAVVSSPNVGTGANQLKGVAAVSANDVWAVGYYSSGSIFQTLVEHWNGTSWAVISSPNVGTSDNYFFGVAAVSADDVWAVGYYDAGGFTYQTLVEHWNGISWAVVSSPNVGTSYNELDGVAVVSAIDVWAVGFYRNGTTYQTLIEHWNGTSWSVASSPSPSLTINELSSVAVLSVTDVWAVGFYFNRFDNTNQTLVERWNGTSWSVVSSPNVGMSTNGLQGVAVVSANDVWAVGHYFNGSATQTLVEHWNGAAWSVVYNPNPSVTTDDLNGVSAVSANDVWTAGYYANGGAYQTLVEHYTPQCIPTSTPTHTPTNTPVPALLVGHVNWEGRPAQPSPLQVLPITLTLKMGATEVNYPTQLTDQYGFFTVTLGTLPNGLYDWRADDSASALHSPNYLANSGTVNLKGAPATAVEMGLMQAGDCDDNNMVNATDFVILRHTFGKSVGDPGYDDRADFTGDQRVNATDFSLLRLNFGHPGAPPIAPGRR